MKIAITGTIGSGKTEASNYLRKKGYDVFDCDEVNRYLLDTKGYELLYKDFKECFVLEKLDKNALANLVFNNQEKRIRLENIMHPLILKELNKRIDDPLFAEVPLLFETGWDKYFDINILIVVDENIGINRLMEKGYSLLEASQRISNQMSIIDKKTKADIIIYNNGNLSQLYETIDNTLIYLC